MEQPDILDQLDNSTNINKYITAGDIASKALDQVLESAGDGVSVKTLCEIGDYYILQEVNKVYSKKKGMKKGIAFPTSIGINNMSGYYSPLDDDYKLSTGDIANIELGVYIDEFPATVAYTLVVGNADNPLTDKRAKLMHAVVEGSRIALGLMKAGKTNKDVSTALTKIALKYDCNLPYVDDPNLRTPGIISYQMSQGVLDGKNDDDETDSDVHKIILSRHHPTYDFEMRPTEFEKNEVYAVDIVMVTGDGKLYPTEERVTIFRRNFDRKYNLKLKASRTALSFFKGNFPQTCRDVMDTRFKLGVVECARNGLLIPYASLAARPGEYVAQIKFTVVIRGKKPLLLTGRSSNSELEKVSLTPINTDEISESSDDVVEEMDEVEKKMNDVVEEMDEVDEKVEKVC